MRNKTKPVSRLEQEIFRITSKAVKNSNTEVAAEDLKFIVHELLPDIDRLIAKKVRQHFYEIGKYIADKFKPGE